MDVSGEFCLNDWSMPNALAILSIKLGLLLLSDKDMVLRMQVVPLLLLQIPLPLSATCWLLRGTNNLQWAPLWKAAGGVHGVDTDDGSMMTMPHRTKIIDALKRLH